MAHSVMFVLGKDVCNPTENWRRMMTRMCLVVTLLLALLCLSVQPAAAGFKSVLFDSFCRPLSDKAKGGNDRTSASESSGK